MVETGDHRIKKYSAKIVPEIIGQRYEATKDLAINKMSNAVEKQVEIEDKCKLILSQVPSIQHHFYMAFAKGLFTKTNLSERVILYRQWKSRGLNNYYLLKIARDLFGLDILGEAIGYDALWSFDRGSGSIAEDSSRWLNNGSISGAAWTASGIMRSALDFDGATNKVTVTDAASIRLEKDNAFSIALWANLDAWDNNVLPRFLEKAPHYITFMGNPANPRYKMCAIEVEDTGAAATEFWGDTELLLDTWYHLVFVFDGATGTGQIYVNGEAESMTTIGVWGGTMQTSVGNDLYIANRADNTRGFDGTLDEVQVWTKALTAEDAKNIYEIQRP